MTGDRQDGRGGSDGKDRFRRAACRGLVLGLIGALGACAAVTSPKSTDRSISRGVGDNLLGEACRIVSAPDEVVKGSSASAFDVYCGTWEEPSGQIFRVKAAATSLDEMAQRGWWRQHLNAFLNCQPPRPTTLAVGGQAIALDCALKQGSWPYQALAVRAGDDLYLADSIPAVLPAVEQGVEVLTGHITSQSAKPTGSMSAEMSRLEARIAKAKYSIGDLQVYMDRLRLAQYYNFQGNYAAAEHVYREALASLQKAPAVDNDSLAFVLMHLALSLSNQERFDEANALFARAEAALVGALDPTLEARLISYRALHYANQRAFAQAATLAHQATERRLQLTERSDGGDDTQLGRTPLQLTNRRVLANAGDDVAYGDIVQSAYTEAAMLVREDKFDAAEAPLREAMTVFRSDGNIPRWWLPELKVLEAEIAERRGDLRSAERLVREAIDEHKKLAVASRGEIDAWLDLGRLLARQYRDDDAMAAFRTAFAMVRKQDDSLRFDAVAPFVRLALAEAKKTPDRQQVLFGEAFQAMQLVRGPVTAQTIALTTARLAAGDQKASRIIRQLQDARAQRDELTQALTQATANPATLPMQLTEMQTRLSQLNSRIGELERAVQAAAPRYNQLVDRSVAAKDVMAALAPDEAVFNVVLGPTDSFAFLIDKKGIKAYEIDLTEREAGRVVSALRRPFGSSHGGPFDSVKAFELYRQLFGPVADRVAAAHHLITVPSGPLLSLPFALLITRRPEPGTEADYAKLAWLIKDHPLTLAPSVDAFVSLRVAARPSEARKTFIGFGDFVPSRDVDGILAARKLPPACRSVIAAVANAPALPETAGELRSVARALDISHPTLYLGSAFTQHAVMTAPLADYRIVYFATHGILPHQLGCLREPSLLTSVAGSADDGLLVTSEIIDLKLDADLVVLSACDTGGAGEKTGGESLSGLARAFFYAGARALLVTHWEIPSEPTVRLMVQTFDDMAQRNLTEAEALRAGQLQLLQSPATANPVNWAAFTLVGDGGRRMAGLRSAPAS